MSRASIEAPAARAPSAAGGGDCGLLPRLGALAQPLRLRRGQPLHLRTVPGDELHAVVSGTLVLESAFDPERRQILLILHPGDIFWSSIVPPQRGMALTAVEPSVVVRIAMREVERLAFEDHAITAELHDRVSNLIARMGLHEAVIGRLTGRERLASFLVELAARIGHPAGAGVVVDIPLSREDIADYLALNPDTLSRLMSQLRSDGLIALPSRRRALLGDLPRLARESPFADALAKLHAVPAARR